MRAVSVDHVCGARSGCCRSIVSGGMLRVHLEWFDRVLWQHRLDGVWRVSIMYLALTHSLSP